MINFNWLNTTKLVVYLNKLTCRMLGHKIYYDYNPYIGKHKCCYRCIYFMEKRIKFK